MAMSSTSTLRMGSNFDGGRGNVVVQRQLHEPGQGATRTQRPFGVEALDDLA